MCPGPPPGSLTAHSGPPTLPDVPETDVPETDLDHGGDRWFLDSEVGDRFPAWTRGNAADVFPDPLSPLAETLYMRPGLSAGLRDAYISMGVLDWQELAIGEPAADLAWRLHARPAEGERVLAAYGGAPDASFRARAAFRFVLMPFHDVVHGLDTGDGALVEVGLAGIRDRDAETA